MKRKASRLNFRAWHNKTKKMILPKSRLSVTENDYQYIEASLWLDTKDEFTKTKDYILMQSTGLEDKNGVEIYEGDIIRFWPIKCGWEHTEIVYCKVRTALCHWPKCVNEDYRGKITEIDSWHGLEVVGNIHENPELMKRK